MIQKTPEPEITFKNKFNMKERALLRPNVNFNDPPIPPAHYMDVIIIDIHRSKPLYVVQIAGTPNVMVDVPESSLLPLNIADTYAALEASETAKAKSVLTAFLDWYRINAVRYESRAVVSVVDAFLGQSEEAPSPLIIQ